MDKHVYARLHGNEALLFFGSQATFPSFSLSVIPRAGDRITSVPESTYFSCDVCG